GDGDRADDGEDDPEGGRSAARPLDEGRLLDRPRQALEIGGEDPDAEGKGHGRIDEEEREEIVVQAEPEHHAVERYEENGLRDDVGGEDRAPPPPEAWGLKPPQRIGGGEAQGERQ